MPESLGPPWTPLYSTGALVHAKLHRGGSRVVPGQISQHIVELRGATLHVASAHQLEQTDLNNLTSN